MLLWINVIAARGEINHAIRFILPNNKMRAGYYIHPASHFGGPASDSAIAPIYGSRWRLKPEFDITGYSEESKVILRALKKYGMFLSDGGNIALTGMSDGFNSNYTYSRLGFGSRDFDDVKPTDFDIMNGFGDDPLVKGRPTCVINNVPIDTNYDESQCRMEMSTTAASDVVTTSMMPDTTMGKETTMMAETTMMMDTTMSRETTMMEDTTMMMEDTTMSEDTTMGEDITMMTSEMRKDLDDISSTEEFDVSTTMESRRTSKNPESNECYVMIYRFSMIIGVFCSLLI